MNVCKSDIYIKQRTVVKYLEWNELKNHFKTRNITGCPRKIDTIKIALFYNRGRTKAKINAKKKANLLVT